MNLAVADDCAPMPMPCFPLNARSHQIRNHRTSTTGPEQETCKHSRPFPLVICGWVGRWVVRLVRLVGWLVDKLVGCGWVRQSARVCPNTRVFCRHTRDVLNAPTGTFSTSTHKPHTTTPRTLNTQHTHDTRLQHTQRTTRSTRHNIKHQHAVRDAKTHACPWDSQVVKTYVSKQRHTTFILLSDHVCLVWSGMFSFVCGMFVLLEWYALFFSRGMFLWYVMVVCGMLWFCGFVSMLWCDSRDNALVAFTTHVTKHT